MNLREPYSTATPEEIWIGTGHGKGVMPYSPNMADLSVDTPLRVGEKIYVVSETGRLAFIDNKFYWLISTEELKAWQKRQEQEMNDGKLKKPFEFRVVDLSDMCHQ